LLSIILGSAAGGVALLYHDSCTSGLHLKVEMISHLSVPDSICQVTKVQAIRVAIPHQKSSKKDPTHSTPHFILVYQFITTAAE
jgi:hypothetical protein